MTVAFAKRGADSTVQDNACVAIWRQSCHLCHFSLESLESGWRSGSHSLQRELHRQSVVDAFLPVVGPVRLLQSSVSTCLASTAGGWAAESACCHEGADAEFLLRT